MGLDYAAAEAYSTRDKQTLDVMWADFCNMCGNPVWDYDFKYTRSQKESWTIYRNIRFKPKDGKGDAEKKNSWYWWDQAKKHDRLAEFAMDKAREAEKEEADELERTRKRYQEERKYKTDESGWKKNKQGDYYSSSSSSTTTGKRAAAFAALGLKFPATPEQIKTAFRGLVKKHHPDLGGDAKMFNIVKDAYNTLTS